MNLVVRIVWISDHLCPPVSLLDPGELLLEKAWHILLLQALLEFFLAGLLCLEDPQVQFGVKLARQRVEDNVRLQI